MMIIMAVVGCFILAGCDKLDDSDGNIMDDVLPGKWTFSYTFKDDADPGLEFQYKYVLFNKDGTCALTYIDTYEPRTDEDGNVVIDENGDPVYDPVYGSLHGTYQATSAMIRIVSSDIDDEERIMLWRVMSLSSKQLIAEYDFDLNTQSFTVVVTLDKQN